MRAQMIWCAAAVAAVGSVVVAQQPVTIDVSDTTRRQVTAFETSLRGAIDAAAERLNRRVREAMPERQTTLAFQRDAIVSGVWMPDGGAVFHVLIPAIEEIDLKLWALLQRGFVASSSTPRPATGTRVGASGVLDPGPVAPAPGVTPLTDPDKEYTQFTREALLDAMLDGALALPIPEGKFLTVLADELQTSPPSPFKQRSRTLILQMSGDDLLALRQNRITRDEAKGRIRESKYPN